MRQLHRASVSALATFALFVGLPWAFVVPAVAAPHLAATIPTGSTPSRIAVNPRTNRIYVLVADGGMAVIDASTASQVATVPVLSPSAIAVNPATNRIYVANNSAGKLIVVNGATNAITATVTVGSRPTDVAVNPVTRMVYVANQESSTVSVIDPAGPSVVATIGFPPSPGDPGMGLPNRFRLGVNPTTKRIFVADEDRATVSIVDSETNSIVATVYTPGIVAGIAVDPRTNRAYVPKKNGDVFVIDGATAEIIDAVPTGATPDGIAVDPATNRIYVASRESGKVSVIDGATRTVAGSVGTNGAPFDLAVNLTTSRVLVTVPQSHEISVIADDVRRSGQTTSVNVLEAPPAVAPVLTISLAEAGVGFGDLSPGGTSAAMPIGSIFYTNTLASGSPWSATVAATSLTSASAVVPFSSLLYLPGASITPGSQSTGTLTPGSAQAFAGPDPDPGTSFSNPITLATAPGTAQGEFTHAGSTVSLHLPLATPAGGYAGTLQYTVIG